MVQANSAEIVTNYIINDDEKSITINDAFKNYQNGFFFDVTVVLNNVINPYETTEKEMGFSIWTYTNQNLLFTIDKYESVAFPTNLVPKRKCDFPCFDCINDSDKRNYCVKCYNTDTSTYRYLQPDPTGKIEDLKYCQPSCSYGWTRNGFPSYECEGCDISCRTCSDLNKFDCIECHPDFPYKYTGDGITKCLAECGRGYYELVGVDEKTCAKCDPNCADCEFNARHCIDCYRDGLFPYLKYGPPGEYKN